MTFTEELEKIIAEEAVGIYPYELLDRVELGGAIKVSKAIKALIKKHRPERYTMERPKPPCPACGAIEGGLHINCPIKYAQRVTKSAYDKSLKDFSQALELEE